MKRNYTKLLLAIALLTAVHYSPAQTTPIEYLNANNVNAGIGIGGALFNGPGPVSDLFEVPKGSNERAIYAAALWMCGADTTGTLHAAQQTYSQSGQTYYDGPISALYNTAYDAYYKRVFKVTMAQVNLYRALTFPATAAQVNFAILIWPGKGNTYVDSVYGINIASPLAPFVDLNGNGIYEPLNGDYPAFCGDQAIFFALNDDRTPNPTGCPKLGVEVHGLATVYNDNSPAEQAVNNTVFIQYEIENKSGNAYHNFNLAFWEDPDLGCYNNDRVGCDTARNMMFVYNGTSLDPNCNTETGYGTTKVSTGTIMLNQTMSTFGYFTNGAVVAQSDPSNCPEYRNYMTGFWNDGTPFTEGGVGYGGTTPTKFIFPGDPNNLSTWSEASVAAILTPGDRRMFGSIGPMNFAVGDVIHYDLAFTTSYDSTSSMFGIVDTLKRDADIVQAFYNNNILSCRSQLIAAEIKDVRNDVLSVSVFPNPANGQLTVQSAENIQLLEMTDMEGRVVLQKVLDEKQTSLNTSALARGVYLLRVKNDGKSVVKKVVLE